MSTQVPFFFGIRVGRRPVQGLHLLKDRVPLPPGFVHTLDEDAEGWLPQGASAPHPQGVIALHQKRVSGGKVWHLLGIWDRSASPFSWSKAIWIAEAPFAWEDIQRDWPHEARRIEDHLGKAPQLPREHNVDLYEDGSFGLICGICGYPVRRGDVGWVHVVPWEEVPPTPSSFDLAMTWLLQAEGGFVDHDDDAGGATRWGISSASYPDLDLSTLTWEGARDIYLRDYWDAYRCGELPPALGIALLDAVVLHGRLGAIFLQRALGVADDGVIGPLTLAAAREKVGDPEVLRDFLARRGVLLASQEEAEIRSFGRGWMLRLFRLADYLWGVS